MTKRFSLVALATASQDIKKSRFIATAVPIQSETEAKAFIAEHAAADAGHNCWAWRVGQAYRFNDDGEPSGTAGKPILQAIDGQNLDGVAVLVSRWFGGILLGSGGLVRAYGGTAAACLREAEKIELIETVSATVTAPFADIAMLQARLLSFSYAKILAQDFTSSGAIFTVSVAKNDVSAMERFVIDSTSSRAQFKRLDDSED